MAVLSDFVDLKSRKLFIDYYYRCITLGCNVCDDAKFCIGEYDNIGVDIERVRDEEVTIPPFVNYIYRDDLAHLRPNMVIRKINLNNVNSISAYGLCYFRHLESVTGYRLEGVSSHAFFDCASLSTLDCKNLKSVGEYAFMFSRLTKIDLPELTNVRKSWCDYSNISEMNVPKLLKLWTIEYTSFRNIKYIGCKGTKIYEQPYGLCFTFGKDLVYWHGCKKTTYIPTYKLERVGLVKRDKNGAYVTWDMFMHNYSLDRSVIDELIK